MVGGGEALLTQRFSAGSSLAHYGDHEPPCAHRPGQRKAEGKGETCVLAPISASQVGRGWSFPSLLAREKR